jgi:ribosomal protein S18 acetylase RimI-like enzyme
VSHTLSLRPVTSADDAFLFELYASTREDIAALGLGDARRTALMHVQWMAQRNGYRLRFPNAEHQVVLVNGQQVGRLWVAREPGELRVVDISLLPTHRNTGLGTSLLRSLQEEAVLAGKPVRLSVARESPARRLYERLGFVLTPGAAVNTTGPYVTLEWNPPTR